jgi:hypothetical protein
MTRHRDSERSRDWALYFRALEILEGRAHGHALPILRRLALRRFPPAMSVLSDHVRDSEALRLLREGARGGDAICAYNLAISHRNRGDLAAYRAALARAARLDPDAAAQKRRFRTRFSSTVMRRLRRLAPATKAWRD